MSLKRRHTSHPNHERWLVSYADFITLLFAFFVVMYAASQQDAGKIGKLATAIQMAFKELGMFTTAAAKAPPTTIEPPANDISSVTALLDSSGLGNLAKLQKELAQALADEIKRHEVAVKVGRDGLVISLREVGFFDSGSATVKMKSEPAVARIAKVLEGRHYYVRIEGHTDNVPIHTARFASNWELSTARATEMAKLFITRYEFPPERLSAAGFGEFHPVAANETEGGRALNRRVDIVVVPPPAKGLSKLLRSANGGPLGSKFLKE
jgi:chemotaxis protein MotB